MPKSKKSPSWGARHNLLKPNQLKPKTNRKAAAKRAWATRRANAKIATVTVTGIAKGSHVPASAFLNISSAPRSVRVELLDAVRDVMAERDEAYGGPVPGMTAQAAMSRAFWDSITAIGGFELRNSPWGACIDMALMKIARIASSPTRPLQLSRDHIIDCINYLAMSLEVVEDHPNSSA